MPDDPLHLDGTPDPFHLAGMMVKPDFTALDIRYIGDNIVFRRLHQSVLNVFGMNKFPLVNDPKVYQKSSTG
jgi:hypothetical protein